MTVFVGLIVALGYTYGMVSGYGYDALVFALAFSTGYTALSWFAGDKMTLWSAGATEITERAQYPYLWNLVENLSITAGLPKPRLYIIQDPSPNAFATGRDPKHASVAVTTGLVERLENEELEGVLAHELSHIGNYDIRWMMLVSVLVGAVSILGDTVFRHGWLSRRGTNDKDNPLAGPLLIIGILFIILSPIIGRLIQLAISRKREYLADASGALLTRYPEGLARALEKIRDARIPLQRTTNATAHLWIADPTAKATWGEQVANLFSTHPPINNRIQELRKMAHAE